MNHSMNLLLPKAFALKPLLAVLTILFSGHTIAAEPNTAIDLASVPVTGNPLGVGADELIVPISILGGRELYTQWHSRRQCNQLWAQFFTAGYPGTGC